MLATVSMRRPTMNLFIQIVSGEFQSTMSQAQSFDFFIGLDMNCVLINFIEWKVTKL